MLRTVQLRLNIRLPFCRGNSVETTVAQSARRDSARQCNAFTPRSSGTKGAHTENQKPSQSPEHASLSPLPIIHVSSTPLCPLNTLTFPESNLRQKNAVALTDDVRFLPFSAKPNNIPSSNHPVDLFISLFSLPIFAVRRRYSDDGRRLGRGSSFERASCYSRPLLPYNPNLSRRIWTDPRA